MIEFSATLGEIVEMKKGISYRSTELVDSEQDGIPLINLKSFKKSGGFNENGLKYFCGDYDNSNLLQPNDLIIANTDLTPNGDILGSPILLPKELHSKNVAFSVDTTRYRITDARVVPAYLYRLLQTPLVRIQFKRYLRGATVKRFAEKDAKKIELSFPTVEEQKRIVAILDKADEIGNNSEQTKILQGQIAESLFIELFGDPILNQNGFPLTTLSDVCEVISGFAFKSAEYSENQSHINLVRGQNISHGFLDWKLGKYWEKMDESLEKYQLFEGDVVLAMDRPIISTGLKISEITTEDMPALLVQRVARIRSSKLPSSFILTLLKHPIFIKTIESSKTETTIPHITLRNVKELQFPLPPLELLEQFSKTLHLFKQITYHTSERISFSGDFRNSLTQQLIS